MIAHASSPKYVCKLRVQVLIIKKQRGTVAQSIVSSHVIAYFLKMLQSADAVSQDTARRHKNRQNAQTQTAVTQ